jgi:hypothetical protein
LTSPCPHAAQKWTPSLSFVPQFSQNGIIASLTFVQLYVHFTCTVSKPFLGYKKIPLVGAMDLEVGKKKAAYRIRIIDLETGKSKTFSVYQKGQKKPLTEIMAKIIGAFQER